MRLRAAKLAQLGITSRSSSVTPLLGLRRYLWVICLDVASQPEWKFSRSHRHLHALNSVKMEAAPPSYESATIVDYWDIIARYMPSGDLCSAALVCSRWHATFAPHLWGNPTSHFGIENDHVYVALTRFKRTLRTARLLVRSLTHTVHLPPAHAEIYNGPHADWLRDILERLPNLQSLIVRGLPFFDHSALQALKYKPPKNSGEDDVPPGLIELPASTGLTFARPAGFIPSYGLRLLDASRCPNITSNSLGQALKRFEGLLYLDLSFTHPARDSVVLNTLRRFTGLQVLKVRGLGLNDDSLNILAPAIARRVRSLDIRDNHITDRGVRTLLDGCFTINEPGIMESGQRSPALLPHMGSEMLEIYQGEDFESFLRSGFTGRFVGRLAIEDAPEGGITHIYCANNQLTVEGVSGLVRSGRLHVLDAQAVQSALPRPPSNASYQIEEGEDDMPSVEKLTPVVYKCAADSMTFLRIDHSLLTKDSPHVHLDEVIQGRVELSDTALPDLPRDAAELDAISAPVYAFELPAVQTPKAELAGDPMQVCVSPAINDPQHLTEDEQAPYNNIRRGSAFAPEVVDALAAETDHMNLLSPVSDVGDGTMMSGTLILSPMSPTFPGPPTPTLEIPTSSGRPRTYSSVASERQARLNAHMVGRHNLHPAMLPRLRTLILTDVPPFWPNKELSDRIICFIRQCAEEAWLAKGQAKLDYSLPPGRKGHLAALKESADKVFALKKIVLELAPEETARRNSKASPWHHAGKKSVTEDRDSETFWTAASDDFSFFGEDDYSFPSLESGRFAHSSYSNDKEINSNGACWPQSNGYQATPAPLPPPRFDTVGLLSAFRKERKLAHQRNVAAGASDPETEGFWEGIVQIVRPGNEMRADELIDYYGNRFENGYLYR